MKRSSRSRGQANFLKIAVAKDEGTNVQKIVVPRSDATGNQSKRRRLSISDPTASFVITPPAIDDLSLREQQLSTAISQFCAIEKVLNTYNQKKRIPDWDSVRDGAIRFCGSDIQISDVNLIVDIYPQAYVLLWRIIDPERRIFELCIKLPSEFLGKLETRSNIFRYCRVRSSQLFASLELNCIRIALLTPFSPPRREKIAEWSLLNPGDQPFVVLASCIPAKPIVSTKVESINRTSKVVLKSLAHEASERRKDIETANKPLGTNGIDNLEKLRERAIMRDKTKDLRAIEELQAKKILDTKNRFLSLPSLCDALRSKCLANNRTCIKTSDLMRHLITELFLTQKELSQRLSILTGIIPEFITVVPADDLVPVSTVRLNLQVPYGLVRKKVLSYVLSVSNET
jgi:hypothetical protein